jgi:FkbM family methyltransferase
VDRKDYINSPLEIAAELNLIFAGKTVDTVFDIGSCEGEDAIRYSRFFSRARVHAFEPRPDNLEAIAQNIKLHGGSERIKVHGVALSDQKGFFDFYVSSGQPKEATGTENWNYGNKSSSLLPPSEEMTKHTSWLQFNEKITVPTERMDSFCREQQIGKVDFIHIDVQGAELKVLMGAGEILKSLTAIWMEVESVELYKGQPLKSDVEHFMNQHNFECILDTVNAVAGDQLYVNKELVSTSVIRQLQTLKRKRKHSATLRRIYNGIARRLRLPK